MNAKRLLKLADFLQALPREKFDFSHIAKEGGKPMLEALKAGKHRCGTVGCALGWSPVVFPRLLRWVPVRSWSGNSEPIYAVCGREDETVSVAASESWRRTIGAAEGLFGIAYHQVEHLFHPEDSGLGEYATPKQVARHIRKFVREQQREAANV